MKTTKIKMKVERLAISGLVVAMLLLAGTVQAVDYKSTYRGIHSQPTFGIATTATAPTATFQSTSAYSGHWSEDAQQSMLNADGSVNSDAYMSSRTMSGPRKSSSTNPGTPGDDDEEEGEQQPLGDAALPLLLIAMAYIAMQVYRREKVVR